MKAFHFFQNCEEGMHLFSQVKAVRRSTRVSEGLLQREFLWDTEWILGNQS